MVAIEASGVRADIGKHIFKSCEETTSNPDQDNVTFPGKKQRNNLVSRGRKKLCDPSGRSSHAIIEKPCNILIL